MPTVVEVLEAISGSERRRALGLVEALAAADPQARLPTALLRFLRANPPGDVYTSPEALTRFIDGGSNRALYDALHAALRERYAEVGPGSLVDLGCGDGRVARAALVASIGRVDLVEPSAALLDLAAGALAGLVPDVRAHTATAADFLAGAAAGERWDVAQSTFALHTMPAGERASVLSALAGRVGRLFMAEFDVPAFADRSAEHAAYCAERYERGLREYDGDAVVAQGFLMPVLVGQFAPGAVRHTHEQPASAWVAELRAAGFADVTVTPLHPYWWADAVLVEATA